MTTEQSVLGSPRLTVRRGQEGRAATPANAPVTHFAREVVYETLPLTGETEYRHVSADDPRRIYTVTDAMEAHADYIETKDDAVLVLEEQVSGDVRVLPYAHRWTADYRDMVYAKLKDAERYLKSTFGEGPIPTTMLTLTAAQRDANGNPRPLGEVLADLLDGWDRFRRVIRRETAGWRTEIFRIVEPHQTGYPHLHVMVFGVANERLQQKVMDLWVNKYGIGGRDAHRRAVEVVRGRAAQVRDPAAYLMKYLSKTVVRSTGEQQQVDGFKAFAALLWVTGRRQYSATEGLSAAMKSPTGDGPPPDQQWRFVGIGQGFETGSYSGKAGEDIIRLVGIRHPPSSRATAGPFGVSRDYYRL